MDDIIQQCLDAHNAYRRKHGAPPLVISDRLMSMAQNWAQTNADQCKMYHNNNRNGRVGENLYATSERLTNGKDPVDSWYNEIRYYRFSAGTGFSMSTGHFTQVVWKSSTELGVGWATGSNGWTYFCCNYTPTGNYQGQFAANVRQLGTPSSPPPALPSQPSSPANVTKPIERSISYYKANSSEIVEAIFSGRLGESIGNRMERGTYLSTNQYLMSHNGQFVAILQEDGNFVLYDRDKGGRADFATGTNNGRANQVQLRQDGHIAVIDESDPENPFWKNRRNADGGECFLIMQDDGNLVGYRGTHDTSSSNAYFSAWNFNL